MSSNRRNGVVTSGCASGVGGRCVVVGDRGGVGGGDVPAAVVVAGDQELAVEALDAAGAGLGGDAAAGGGAEVGEGRVDPRRIVGVGRRQADLGPGDNPVWLTPSGGWPC